MGLIWSIKRVKARISTFFLLTVVVDGLSRLMEKGKEMHELRGLGEWKDGLFIWTSVLQVNEKGVLGVR